MVLEIIHLIIMTAMLTCGLVVAWYAHRIHAAQARELAFLDARDLDQRRQRAEARHAGQAWNKELSNWHRDTRAILGKLYAIAAESSPEERDTRLMPPPTQPPLSAPTSSAYRAVSPSVPVSVPAPIPMPASAPALVAAGMGPRPPASSLVSTRRPPPITVADPPAPSRPAPSRRATVMGLQPVDSDAPDRISWGPLKHAGGLGGSTQPARVEPRFPGTLLSMPSPAASTSSRARAMAPVETKSICQGCDGGFIAVGHGGIGKCHDCDGSGFIDAR